MAAFSNLKQLKTLEIGEPASGLSAKHINAGIWAGIRGPETSTIEPEAKRLLERSQKLIEESKALIKRAEELAEEARELAEQAAELSERALQGD